MDPPRLSSRGPACAVESGGVRLAAVLHIQLLVQGSVVNLEGEEEKHTMLSPRHTRLRVQAAE